MTADDLINAVASKLKIGIDGEDLETEDQEKIRDSINILLSSLADQGISYPSTYEVTKSLTAGTESYTIGESSADISAIRPEMISSAFIRDSSGHDDPVNIIGEKTYNKIYDKDIQSGLPYNLFFKAGVPNGTIYIYPASFSSTDTLYIYCVRQFPELSTSEGWEDQDLSTTVGIAKTINRFLIFNAAVDLMPDYGAPPEAQLIIQIAAGTRKMLLRQNVARRMQAIGSPFGYRSSSFSVRRWF
jgi:hypothetical protein